MEKIPYVQRVRKPDGRIFLYFRKGDYREGPLGSPDGSEALREEVNGILKRLEQAERAKKPKPGTVGGMLREYNRSAGFLVELACSTQREYQRIIDELADDCGGVMLADVTPEWVKDMRDVWAERGYKAANDRRQILYNALKPAIEDDRIKVDPFIKVKKLMRPHDAGESHPIWEDEEVQATIAYCLERGKPGLARATALGRWGGFRRCAIPLNARTTGYDQEGRAHRRIHWITGKCKVLADKREDPRLTALLDGTPNKALTIAYNARGEAWKVRQLNQAIDRIVEALAKAGKTRGSLTIHGLRHSRGVELALAGASDAEIMSQLEHATDRAAKIYRRQADRRRLADAGQDRVDSVVALRERRKAEGKS